MLLKRQQYKAKILEIVKIYCTISLSLDVTMTPVRSVLCASGDDDCGNGEKLWLYSFLHHALFGFCYKPHHLRVTKLQRPTQ